MTELMQACRICPRSCGARRERESGQGFCRMGVFPRVARAALHFWEEPCISGTKGSGTVFFSGCTLKCCFCQNYPISAEGLGKEITVEHLAEIFLNLQAQGAHNINLVTPGQWQPWIIAALDIARTKGLRLPIVCNTGGYETVEAVRDNIGFVDAYLTDFKYADGELAARYSRAADYPEVALAALKAMVEATGAPRYDEFRGQERLELLAAAAVGDQGLAQRLDDPLRVRLGAGQSGRLIWGVLA